jgi:hypothetical protein
MNAADNTCLKKINRVIYKGAIDTDIIAYLNTEIQKLQFINLGTLQELPITIQPKSPKFVVTLIESTLFIWDSYADEKATTIEAFDFKSGKSLFEIELPTLNKIDIKQVSKEHFVIFYKSGDFKPFQSSEEIPLDKPIAIYELATGKEVSKLREYDQILISNKKTEFPNDIVLLQQGHFIQAWNVKDKKVQQKFTIPNFESYSKMEATIDGNRMDCFL